MVANQGKIYAVELNLYFEAYRKSDKVDPRSFESFGKCFEAYEDFPEGKKYYDENRGEFKNHKIAFVGACRNIFKQIMPKDLTGVDKELVRNYFKIAAKIDYIMLNKSSDLGESFCDKDFLTNDSLFSGFDLSRRDMSKVLTEEKRLQRAYSKDRQGMDLF